MPSKKLSVRLSALKVIRESKGRPSSAEIIASVQRLRGKVAAGQVYNNLSLLKAAGKVEKVGSGWRIKNGAPSKTVKRARKGKRKLTLTDWEASIKAPLPEPSEDENPLAAAMRSVSGPTFTPVLAQMVSELRSLPVSERRRVIDTMCTLDALDAFSWKG
jgi:hypothetical protein